MESLDIYTYQEEPFWEVAFVLWEVGEGGREE